MPGNKKPRKNAKRPGPVQRLYQSRLTKKVEEVRGQTMAIRIKNGYPMGDPENRHKIDITFAPIEKYLRDAQAGGEMPVDEKNRPIMYDELEDEWKHVPTAFRNICWMFELVGHTLKWDDKQPPGMRLMANKLDYDMPLNDADVDGALATIAWMRKRIETVSPNQWSATFALAVEIEEQREAQRRADNAGATL